MLYLFIGQSCTGKSTVADQVKERIGAEVFAGKDYLRLAKNENEAWRLFHAKLSNAASIPASNGGPMIYLVSESAQLDRLRDIEGACRVKFTASLDTIKSRFAQRMQGRLPAPVEKMLANQYEAWETIQGDIHVDTTVEHDIEKILSLIGFK